MPIEALEQRVVDAIQRIRDLEEINQRTNPAVIAEQVRAMGRELGAMRQEIADAKNETRGLRRAVIGFALTVAGSAVAFALTVILTWGHT